MGHKALLALATILILSGTVPEKPKITTTYEVINGVEYVIITAKAL